MRAVFRCIAGAYKQVGYWDVNATVPIYGTSYDEELVEHKRTHICGSKVNLPDTVTDRARLYLFSEGKNHNQLTLTDPKEIYNMRKWLQSHAEDFIEVSCDEEAEHITEAVFKRTEAFTAPTKVELPKAPKEATEAQEEPTEWDNKYTKILRKR